jgi:hypothetical protein
MDKKKKTQLTWKKGLTIYAISWVVTFFAVFGLRQTLIPKDELDCYARVAALQKAVNQFNQAHPDKPFTDKNEIDENALVQGGFMTPLTYDHEKHYYFVGETAHGLRVKCNKHEDNPLILKLTGDFILAMLVFVVFCTYRGYVLFADES